MLGSSAILYCNRKFWEELIAYFPFTIISVSDPSREKTLYICVMKPVKQYRLRGCNAGITNGRDL
jgi:hypothetical protein